MKLKLINNFILVISVVMITFFLCSYSLFVVSSGSMEPTIKVGSLIVVNKEYEIKEQKIITFYRQSQPITHRIVKIDGNQIITKGDANVANDPWTIQKDEIIGEVIITIPYIGYVLFFVRKYYFIVILFMLGWIVIKRYEKNNKANNL